MSDELEFGLDTSRALAELAKLQKASQSAMGQIAGATREAAAAQRALEKAFGSAIAATVRGDAAFKKQSASIKEQIGLQDQLARATEKAYKAAGLTTNSGGRVVNSGTGRFASADQIAAAARAAEQYVKIEERGVELDRMRAINAQNAYAREQQAAAAARQTTAEYKAREAILQKAFSGNIVGLAAPDATHWQKFANVLNQIPPLTWGQKLGAAQDKLLQLDNSARYALYSVAASAAVASAGFFAFGAAATGAAISHERAFANVERTTQTTELGYRQLQRQIEVLATQIPIAYEELTQIATAAGQLGIQASGVANFTKVVGQLAATTNLSSEAAGNALARFKSFFAEAADPSLAVTERTFSNLASSILKVGVNSIATESGIVNVSTQISSMGKYAGFTADQVIGLAGALSSVGVAPELARGITTRLFTIMGDAVSESGVQLEKFASIAGVSGSEFRAAWGTEAMAPLFRDFLQGLNGVTESGGDANAALRDLGITAVRDRPVWLRLASAAGETGEAGSLLAQTLSDAREGWRQNIELGLQYSKISDTASARIQVMAQAFEQLFAAMGKQTGNFLGEAAENITDIVRGFEEFAQSDFGQFIGTVVTQASFLVGGMLALIGALAGVAATAQAVGAGFRAMTASGVTAATTLTSAFRVLSLSAGLIGIVSTLAVTVGALGIAAFQSRSPIEDFSGLLSAMKSDAEAGSRGITFVAGASAEAAAEARNTAKQASDMADALYGVSDGGESAAGGLDAASAAADKARYVFGETAMEVYKSQLALDEGFQNLFSQDWSQFFPGTNQIDTRLLDWDRILKESIREGGDVARAVQIEINKQLGTSYDFGPYIFDGTEQALFEYSQAVARSLGNSSGEIQKQIDAQSALSSSTSYTVSEMIDDYTLLDDATQDLVENAAKGFEKFADPSTLIGLTQKLVSSEEDAAEQFRAAWSDAYGGASFDLGSYLTVFRDAYNEQQGFVSNLQQLSARGLSTSIIEDLSAMGPEANRLVQALVDGSAEQLAEFEDLWGRTGYDTQLKFATQAAIANEVVKNVMNALGLDGLKAFNDALASGVDTDAALAQLQLTVDGKPIEVTPELLIAEQQKKWAQEAQRYGISIPVTPYLTQSRVQTAFTPGSGGGSLQFRMFDSGGYTGAGGKFDPAGIVHRDEFVFTKEATRNIGVSNLYAMMRAAQSGRAAPRGRGYAQGGLASGSMNAGPVRLDEWTIQRLAQVMDKNVYLDSSAVGRTVSVQNERSTRLGAS